MSLQPLQTKAAGGRRTAAGWLGAVRCLGAALPLPRAQLMTTACLSQMTTQAACAGEVPLRVGDVVSLQTVVCHLLPTLRVWQWQLCL